MPQAALRMNDIVSVVTTLGQVLQTKRESLEQTTLEVSKQVNIGQKTIELVEAGRTDMQLDYMLCLLFHFGMDIKLPNSSTPARPQDFLKARLKDMQDAIYHARRPKGEPRRVSLKTISDISGIEQGQIGKIESGDIIPRFRTFLALMQALNIPVSFGPIDEAINNPKKLPKVPVRPIIPRRRRSAQVEGLAAAV